MNNVVQITFYPALTNVFSLLLLKTPMTTIKLFYKHSMKLHKKFKQQDWKKIERTEEPGL